MSIVNSLRASGWKPDDHGVLRYLPVGDNDYDWNATSVSDLPTVMADIQTKANMGEVIGVVLTFENTAIGGAWLFFPNGDITFTPGVNRRKTDYGSDVGWYLLRVLPALQSAGDFDVESWRWEESL